MLYRRALSLTLLCLVPLAPLWAGTITIEPERPTSQDVFRVAFHENMWFEVCEPTLKSIEVLEDRIVLKAVPPGSCTLQLVHNPYDLAAEVGPLPAGKYTVIVETVDGNNGLHEPVTQTSEVSIAEASGPGPDPSPAMPGCVRGPRPAATLLLPYFEVDLEDPSGRNTLASVYNVSSEAVVAHVVVWTNWAVPVLSFDLAIAGDGVRSIDLRSLIVDARLPMSELPQQSEALFPRCARPLEVPELDPAAHASLLARLSGQPDPPIVCYSSPVEGGRVANGFVTIDVVGDCSGSELRHPLDDGYFSDGGFGLAADSNVLWGDFYLVDVSQSFAQGLELVSVIADAERFGAGSETFYHRPESHRAPLGHTYRTRFFRGGAFDGGTELLVWNGSFEGEADNCGTEVGGMYLEANFRNEAGVSDSTRALFHNEATMRLRLGEEMWSVGASFGSVDLSTGGLPGTTEPFPVARQGWVAPLLSAGGRYSVGLNAVQLEGPCP